MNTEEFKKKLKDAPLSVMAVPEGPEYWKTRAIIKIELDGEEIRTELRGDADKLCSMLAQSLERLIHEEPMMRRKLHKYARALWRNTRSDSLNYWLDGWPWTVLGVAVMFGLAYIFAAIMRWIGGLL